MMDRTTWGWVALLSLAALGCGSDESGGAGGTGSSSTVGNGGAGVGGAASGGAGTAGASTGGEGPGAGGAASGGGGAGGYGTGGDATGGAGGVANCDTIVMRNIALQMELGCTDNSAGLQTFCESLYDMNVCVAEWEALQDCLAPKATSDFECDGTMGGVVDPKDGVCAAERTAFVDCLP